MIYPANLLELIEYFKKLPGIGEKSAERMALAILDMSLEEVADFSLALNTAKKKLKRCSICGGLTDEDECYVCRDISRNHNVICVLEDFKGVFAFEKAGKYNGVYHVLDGLISPIDDRGPEDINLSSLIDRVKTLENPEVIIALKPSIEGETTTLYINKILEDKGVKISRLSYGIPMGVDIDYLDEITLLNALNDRKDIS